MLRREFLQSMFGLTAAALFPAPLGALAREVARQSSPLSELSKYGAFHLHSTINKDPTGKQWVWLVLESKSGRLTEVPLPFSDGHSIELNREKSLGFIAGLVQDKSSLVDIPARKIIRTITPEETGHVFSGHGAFAPDGKYLLTAEYLKDLSGPGYVCLRSLPDLKVVSRFSTGLLAPHDIKFTSTGRYFAVGHLGNPGKDGVTGGGQITYRYPEMSKVDHLPVFDNYTLQHLCAGSKDNFIFSTRNLRSNKELYSGTAELPSPVIFGSAENRDWRAQIPPKPDSDYLYNFSPTYLPKQREYAVAHKGGSRVSFWSEKRPAFIASVKIPTRSPQAIAWIPSSQFLLVATNPGSKLYVVHVEKHTILQEIDFPGIAWSPHMVVIPA